MIMTPLVRSHEDSSNLSDGKEGGRSSCIVEPRYSRACGPLDSEALQIPAVCSGCLGAPAQRTACSLTLSRCSTVMQKSYVKEWIVLFMASLFKTVTYRGCFFFSPCIIKGLPEQQTSHSLNPEELSVTLRGKRTQVHPF